MLKATIDGRYKTLLIFAELKVRLQDISNCHHVNCCHIYWLMLHALFLHAVCFCYYRALKCLLRPHPHHFLTFPFSSMILSYFLLPKAKVENAIKGNYG